MNPVVDHTKNFNALIEKLDKPQPSTEARDPLETLVVSFLMWDSTTEKAKAAFELVLKSVVDFNDLRISVPVEIAGYMGPDYPQAEDRAQKLKLVLRDIYLREHEVTLKKLADMGKREIKKYLRSLDGMVPYVADRVMLLCYSIHCIPADNSLRSALSEINACDDSLDLPELAAWITRQVKASQDVTTHLALQAWVDEKPLKAVTTTDSDSTATTTRKKTTSKKTPKQTAASTQESS